MKLSVALKKLAFLKKLDVSDTVIAKLANHLVHTTKGSEEVYFTPIAKKADPIHVYVDWNFIFNQSSHKLNGALLDLENANKSKFGPRSIALPWAARVSGLRDSYSHQSSKFKAVFSHYQGDGNLCPISLDDAVDRVNGSSSSGLPDYKKKSDAIKDLLANFDKMYDRNDPCVLFTRTQENNKTRNVWGYPFADALYETLFYVPILLYQRNMFHRASLVSPDLVDQRISLMIHKAIYRNLVLYSVDFAAFDSSVKYQYIIEAFEFIKSCFIPVYHEMIDEICYRMYNIRIVTPSGVYKGPHGIPSGSTFTNEIDSIIQLGISMTLSFIHYDDCQIQGDDGVYMLAEANIAEFDKAFKSAGLVLEKSKSHISSDYAIFCQKLYHIDYSDDSGFIGGIYPTWRAINRILFQERFVNFKRLGISGKDYFGIRTLTILENCKYHPLFEDLVRFVLTLEKFSLDISEDGLVNYYNAHVSSNDKLLNEPHGFSVMGIRNFESYKLVQRILEEEDNII